MKISDDYRAKVRLWAIQPTVVPLPPVAPMPKFASRRFVSHEELNQWKLSRLRELARTIVRHD